MIPISNGLFNGLRNGLRGVKQRLSNYLAWLGMYLSRVNSDGGVINSSDITREYYRMADQNSILQNILFAWLGGAGAKFNSGNFSKLYSLFGSNDATQATALNQPYLGGNIAPNERYAMVNPQGNTRLISITPTSYLTTDIWSALIVLNNNGGSADGYFLGGGTNTRIGFQVATGKIIFCNETGTSVTDTVSTAKYIGKTIIMHLLAAGDGTLQVYINGTLHTTISNPTNVTLTNIFHSAFYGKYFAPVIRSQNLTASQITAEYNFFRSIYPEIPTVAIGAQKWQTSNLDVVCTPQGNVFPEITDNANVECIADGDFATDTVWVKGAGWTISGGVAVATAATGVLYQDITIGANKYAKIVITVLNYTSGSIQVRFNSISLGYISANGTYTYFAKTGTGAQTRFEISANVTLTAQVDNVSTAIVGWSGLTEVYDAIYAATAGSATVKDQAACLAAAAWCHYNNDPANGAVYGKLYNWYAARTLQYDIDDYNTANPTAKWGYHVPTNLDFATLLSTLGGSSTAGGFLKKEGLVYWASPNVGADNSSGFSAIGSGSRGNLDGQFGSLKSYFYMWGYNYSTPTNPEGVRLNKDANEFIETSGYLKPRGNSIRLLKD